MGGVEAMVEAVGYALAALGFVLLTLLLVTSFRRRLRSLFLAGASGMTAIWAAGITAGTFVYSLTAFQIYVLEFSLDAAWLIFLSSLMGVGGTQFVLLRRLGIGVGVGLLLVGVVLELAFRAGFADAGAEQLLIFGQIITALVVLINVEQIIRNAREQQQRGLKYLCLGVGALFAYDLIMYSQAILGEHLSPSLWAARGYVAAMTLPMLVVAVSRTPMWSGGIFVSRQVVFHTATVFSAGIYLTFIGLAGQYIREFGGSWGSVAQIIFVSAAILALSVIIFSERLRLRLRVFISKHFYRNKYDYRQEWLRLTETMNLEQDGLPLQKRAIRGLADIVRAPSGQLWLKSADGKQYESSAGWNVAGAEGHLSADASLPAFLVSSGWIVDLDEYRNDPGRYKDLTIDETDLLLEKPRFIIPLDADAGLIGFVVLSAPKTPVTLNYEDRDLLKTAGRQVASYIAQEAATELLAQGRQFEAFNKMTAYLMHDLKNVIAQQSLLVENAQKHKQNPDFVDDAIATIDSGVVRMRRVIEQLQQNSVRHRIENVELGSLVRSAASHCSDRKPKPRANVSGERLWVRADKERLHMAICHAIRNAQDATDAEGSISVDVNCNGATCDVVISDTGKGMDEAFIRDRLFRPFDSTKGTQGMGIGAYQIRETLRSVGGDLGVESAVGAGTTVTMTLRTRASAEKV